MRRLGTLLTLGTQLAAAVAGFGLAGYWIDRHFGTGSTWTTVMLFLGAIGGMYSFIRTVQRAGRERKNDGGDKHED